MDIPDGLRYTDDHEWLRVDGSDGIVGVTAYAAEQLGDVVFVELPAVGRKVEKSQAFGVIESVKTASDLYAPVSGEVVEVNSGLVDQPQAVNDDPYSAGWMIRIRADDPSQVERLLTAEQYADETGE